jgi:hypothetical protein
LITRKHHTRGGSIVIISALEKHVPPTAIVVAGVALSFAAALVPHHAHAVQMLPLQALLGLLPYALYGVIAALLKEPIVARAGLIVLGVHLIAVLVQRGLTADHGSGPLLSTIPLLLSAGLLMLWPRALHASDPTRRSREQR